MAGGTIGVARDVNNHSRYKKRLEELGFRDVMLTAAEKDGLNMVINDMKPRLVLVASNFYQCGTPYMLGRLAHTFPQLNIASVSLGEYPAELAMAQIINGVTSYVNYYDGAGQFYDGLKCIKEGKAYIANVVQERIDMRHELPHPSRPLSERQFEVLRCLCNGFTAKEIAETLHICERTVEAHREECYIKLSVRNEKELIRMALYLGFIQLDELIFYGRDFELSPKPLGKAKACKTKGKEKT